MLGEGGLVGDGAVGGEGVVVGDLRGPEVGRVERAVGVQLLAVADGHGVAGLALQLHAGDADHVLAEVVDELAGGRLGALEGRDLLGGAHRLVGLRHHLVGGRRADGDRAPAAVVVLRLVPAVLLGAGVVRLTVDVVGERVRAGVAGPGVVGVDPLGAAVAVVEPQPREQRQVVAVHPGAPHADLAAPPAVGQLGAERVGAGAHLVGDVVGLVLDAGVVVGPAGCEVLVADLLAVEVQLVDAAGRRVDAGAGEGLALGGVEVGAQQRQVVVGRAVQGLEVAGDLQAAGRQRAGREGVAVGCEVGVEQGVAVLGGDPHVVHGRGLGTLGRHRGAEADEALREGVVGAGVDGLAVELGGDGRAVDGDRHRVRAVEQLGHRGEGGDVLVLDQAEGAVDPAVRAEPRGAVGHAELPHEVVAQVGGADQGAEDQVVDGEVELHGVVGPAVDLRATRAADPVGVAPVGRREQAGLERRRLAPLRRLVGAVPDLDLPHVAGARLERGAAVDDVDLLVGGDLPGAPQVVGAEVVLGGSDPDLVGALHDAAGGRLRTPRQAGSRGGDAERVDATVDLQAGHGGRCGRRSLVGRRGAGGGGQLQRAGERQREGEGETGRERPAVGGTRHGGAFRGSSTTIV